MATYLELESALTSDALQRRIRIAMLVAVEKIRTEQISVDNHANRIKWAKLVLTDLDAQVPAMVRAVVSQFNGLPIGNITGANDAAVQLGVDASINSVALG